MKAYGDDSFWFSKLSAHRTCPRLYQLQHIDKIKVESRSLDTEFGTALHLALEALLRGEDGVMVFNTYWEYVDPNLLRFKYDKKSLGNMGPIFIERFARLHLKHLKVFNSEERLFITEEGHKLEGTPDLIGWYKGTPSVMDFKTSSSKYMKEKIISDDQMPSYAHYAAVEKGFNVEQAVYFVFVKDFKTPSIQILTHQLTTVDIQASISNMVAEIEEIKAKKVFTQNRSSCVRGPIKCSMWDQCHGRKSDENK